MDFLDPKKLRAYHIRLMIGYGLVAIAVVLATVILIFQANGYGVKQGKVVQNGLIFVQARPAPATLKLNGETRATTNTRLALQAGSYTMQLSRSGYRDWQRALTVEGGSVEHLNYVFMLPTTLSPNRVQSYASVPPEMKQSPDRRWLVVRQPGQLASYEVYDVRDPEGAVQSRETISVPNGIFALPATANPQAVEIIEWSNDNDHMLLRHTSGTQAEYVLFSRETPASSVNLTKSLQLNPTQVLNFQDKRYDRYFIHDTAAHTLSTVSLANPQGAPLLTNVLSYKSYGSDTVVYTSAIFGQTDKVQLKLFQDRKQHTIRTLPASPTYLLALSRYDGAWFIAAGVPAENRIYIYKDPAESLKADPALAPASVAVLKLANPVHVSFSANSEMILAHSDNTSTNFAVYDAEYDRSHNFHLDAPIDAPQTKVEWLDSHHLSYVSNGKAVMVDYDGTNFQTLSNQIPGIMPLYDTTYVTLYTLAKPTTIDPAKPETTVLSATPLRTPADQ